MLLLVVVVVVVVGFVNEDGRVSVEEVVCVVEDWRLEALLLLEPCMGGTGGAARLLKLLLKRLRRTEVVPMVSIGSGQESVVRDSVERLSG